MKMNHNPYFDDEDIYMIDGCTAINEYFNEQANNLKCGHAYSSYKKMGTFQAIDDIFNNVFHIYYPTNIDIILMDLFCTDMTWRMKEVDICSYLGIPYDTFRDIADQYEDVRNILYQIMIMFFALGGNRK
jgi:hypothetical protein